MRIVAGPAGKFFLLLLCAGAVLAAWSLRDLTFAHNTRSLLRADPAASLR